MSAFPVLKSVCPSEADPQGPVSGASQARVPCASLLMHPYHTPNSPPFYMALHHNVYP